MLTTSLGLKKPELTDNADLTIYVGQNMDTLNSLISGKADASHTHANATTSVGGFMASSDKSKLDGIQAGAQANVQTYATVTAFDSGGIAKSSITAGVSQDTFGLMEGSGITLTVDGVNKRIKLDAVAPSSVPWSNITSKPTTIAGYGITDAVSTGANTFTGNQTAPVIISNVAIGTAPLQVTSTTKVTNLNADMVDGYTFNQDVQTTANPTFAGLKTSGVLIIGGTTNYVSSPAATVYLAPSNNRAMGMDTYGNLLPISPASIIAGNAWNVLGKDGVAALSVKIDGTTRPAVSTPYGYGGMGRISAFSYYGTINTGAYLDVTHNLGYNPIITWHGTIGNIILTQNPISANVTRLYVYSSGGSNFTGTIYFW